MLEGQKKGKCALEHTSSPANENFLDKHGDTIKHHITEQHNTHKGYVNRSDKITEVTMSNSYGIHQHT
jgi:hypothetical protein